MIKTFKTLTLQQQPPHNKPQTLRSLKLRPIFPQHNPSTKRKTEKDQSARSQRKTEIETHFNQGPQFIPDTCS
jgi:hypothetical protein